MSPGLSPLGAVTAAAHREPMKDILLVINGPAYGSDQTYNAFRVAVALAARDDTSVQVFLMGDAVTCAASGQKTPDGYYPWTACSPRSPARAATSPAVAPAWTPGA